VLNVEKNFGLHFCEIKNCSAMNNAAGNFERKKGMLLLRKEQAKRFML
jgi:hypothetical protein